MILSVILGVAIDTPRWIEELRENEADYIAVVDYDYTGEPEQREDILYLSPLDAKNYMKNFDSVEFFTCFYGLPGMGGNINRAPVLNTIPNIQESCMRNLLKVVI